MALGLNGSQYLNKAFSAITAYPITIFARAHHDTLVTGGMPANYTQDAGSYYSLGLFLDGAVAGDPATFYRLGPTFVRADSTGAYSTGVWYGVLGRGQSGTAFDVSLDSATTVGPNTAATFPASLIRLWVGAYTNGAVSNYLNGAVCQVALWDAALDDAERDSLVRGFSPRRIRPQSLKAYMPFVRDLTDLVNPAVTWSDAGHSKVPGPRLYGV